MQIREEVRTFVPNRTAGSILVTRNESFLE